jgi:FkbM family methyltransferase
MAPPDRVRSDLEDRFLFCYDPQPGDTVVDAGAGIGTEVLPLSELVGPEGRVIAVEAHPETFRQLWTLCELNGLRNVSLVYAALGAQRGRSLISDAAESQLNTIVGVERGARVPVETLDHILENLDVKHVDFLKMNIEGAERQALEGFSSGLGNTTHLAVACHDFLADRGLLPATARTKADIRAILQSSGFSLRTREADSRPWIRDYLYGRRTGAR